MLFATQSLVRPVAGLAAMVLLALLGLPPAEAAQAPPSLEAKGPPPADPRDLSGRWVRASVFQTFGAVKGGANEYAREIQDAQVSNRQPDLSPEKASIKGLKYDEPVFTPAGKAAWDRARTGYGLKMTDLDRNDPQAICDPLGVPRMLVAHAAAGFGAWEIVQQKHQMVWLTLYHHNYRVVLTDGRPLPTLDDDLYRSWNGYAVGHWEGNTFVVNSVGFNDKSWLDHNGFPKSDEMRLEERYRLLDANTLEVRMTVNDPVYYAQPFHSDVKIFKRDTDPKRDWDQQYYCVPSEEGKFNTLIRDGGL